jgi:hypothetical protein
MVQEFMLKDEGQKGRRVEGQKDGRKERYQGKKEELQRKNKGRNTIQEGRKKRQEGRTHDRRE